MRKLLAIAATLGVAALGVLVPATGAQASTACDTAWQSVPIGSFYAYDDTDCSGSLGRTTNNDADWGDSSGAFQSGDNDRASSVLHKGTSGLAIRLFQGAGYTGGHACLNRAEAYVSDLAGHTFSNGASMNNAISSHRWVPSSDCDTFLD